MRVLHDEQLPRHLAGEIAGHDISTVQQCGWAGLKNGELLRPAAAEGFDVLVTADRKWLQVTLSRICFHLHPAFTPLFRRVVRVKFCG